MTGCDTAIDLSFERSPAKYALNVAAPISTFARSSVTAASRLSLYYRTPSTAATATRPRIARSTASEIERRLTKSRSVIPTSGAWVRGLADGSRAAPCTRSACRLLASPADALQRSIEPGLDGHDLRKLDD